MIWYDYAVIRMSCIFESSANIGLVRQFDSTLRAWVNTGTLGIAGKSAATVALLAYKKFN